MRPLGLKKISHGPRECAQALAGATSPVALDIETTGLDRRDQIASVGLLVDGVAYILLVGTSDVSTIKHRITWPQLHNALAPLAQRDDLVLVLHNAVFDLTRLDLAGVKIVCQIHDAQKMLKLHDSDRGKEKDDGTGNKGGPARYERRFREWMNYRLKAVVKHEGLILPIESPDNIAGLPYREHVRYLTSDLLVTKALHDHLLQTLHPSLLDYNSRLIAPIAPLLVAMSNHGVMADKQFIISESDRFETLMQTISATHAKQFTQRLDAGDCSLWKWVYKRLGCGGRHKNLKSKTLRRLWDQASKPSTLHRSLGLLLDYKLAGSQMIGLRKLTRFIDRQTGLIHTNLNDHQASGRVSSSSPPLQSLSHPVQEKGKHEFVSTEFKVESLASRNALIARPGHTLVGFDIGQADVRCLAHLIASQRQPSAVYLRQLQNERQRRLWPEIRRYHKRMQDCLRQENVKQQERQADFTPGDSPLPDDFNVGGTDFYTVASQRMLGREPKDRTERLHLKSTILGIVNGMSVATLADQLSVTLAEATGYHKALYRAYPDVVAFTAMMHNAIAITGKAESFAGRQRRVTPHWWMVNEPRIELFISYSRSDKLWVRVVPLRPNRHTLTCFVISVVDAQYGSSNEGKEIYHHRDGRISSRAYRFFQDDTLIYRLPIRNISWRLIRKVRTAKEEAKYEGFDKTKRQLFNHLAQASTADVVKLMMLRAEPVCRQLNAHLLLQIHDELLFEVPDERVSEFLPAMKTELEERPEGFLIPIVVEPKMGKRFGSMEKVHI